MYFISTQSQFDSLKKFLKKLFDASVSTKLLSCSGPANNKVLSRNNKKNIIKSTKINGKVAQKDEKW